MKSRSQRLPINDQPDDWVDGSWTVDCMCGVNYDDGEEMVNCDECGVWVHTRCSRFVRGETSFACDKCKRRKKKTRNQNINHNNNNSNNYDNEEETEVAQLLVELPAKTIAATMNGANNNGKSSYMTSSSPAPARSSSLMLWTHIPPVEERVHVQGVPGGDPKLFKGVSAVFTPELWKCSGYVPKKFNFQYREFPCWEDEEENHENREEEKKVEGSDNPGDNPVAVDNHVDSGADALFSLSKKVVSASPVEMLVGLRGSGESGSREKSVAQKEGRSRGSEDSSGRYVQSGAGKEGNQGRASGVHLGKRKDGLRSKDLGGKKKARSAGKEVEGKRRVPSSAISGDKTESIEVGEAKIVATDFQVLKNKDKLTTFDHKADNGSNANTSKLKDHSTFSAHYARDSSRKEKFKDGIAAPVSVHHNKDLSKKVNSRDNLEANGEDSYGKVKPKVILEAKSHNVDDSSKKGKSKDKLFAKPHHVEDFSKKAKSKDNQASNVYRGEDTSKETWGNSSLVEIVVKSENAHEDRSRNGSSSEAVTVEVSLLEPADVNAVTKNEDLNSVGGLDHLNDGKRDPHGLRVNLSNFALPSSKLKPPVTEVPKNRVQDSNESKALDSLQPDINVKTEANEIMGKVTSSVVSSLMVDVKLDETESLDQHPSISVSEHPRESLPVHEADKSSIPLDEKTITESSAISCCIEDNAVEGMLPVSGEPCQNKEVIGSAGTLSVQECSSETKHLKCGEELSKTGGSSPSIPTSLPQRNKIVLGCGKSASAVLISKSEVSGGCKPPGRPASPSTLRPIHFTKRVKTTSNADGMKDQIKLNSNGDTRKDDTMVDTIKEDHRQDEPRKTVVEQLKASTVSASKSSHMSRVSHASISKRSSTDSKEVVHCSYSKAPTAHNVTVCSGSIESINAMQSQSVSQVQSKTIASDFPEKGEKSSQSVCHPSKVTSSSMHPPAPVNSSSTLSDEELALLLHQELNSSPRVPRVPRARQPQLASSAATNMLIKRASGAGVKDHIWASRRKNKEEVQKEASNSSGELSDERKKTGRVLSNDHQRQDEVLTSDSSTKKEAPASPEAEHSTVKHMPLASTSTFGQSSSTEVIDQNLSSPHNSSRNTSDDDDGNDDDVDDEDADANEDDADGVAGPATRTLPGLLDEIMSKGKRMTYEELCNAVLPHWNNLRKHNGERYAYSSHSQAVLDCLRNRSEWARLVDRGPKTNPGRKKGRPESDPHVVEPEEHVYNKSRMSEELVGKKFDVHTEDFPKGKRKARKRRRLALQGRGIRDVRKRQKTNAVVTDEDLGPFSHSSDTGDVFSEDGQGARARPNGSEVSASSDDADQ